MLQDIPDIALFQGKNFVFGSNKNCNTLNTKLNN